MLKHHHRSIAVLCSALAFSVFAAASVHASENESPRYRYKNSEGVPVISNTMPAHYAQNGYEILDRSNNVVKIVPPAPSEEDVEKAQQQRTALAAYELLKRRYSSIDDIERAKDRRLQNINTNISILKGNINTLQASVSNIVNEAAEFERSGRQVPENILSQLDDVKKELSISEDLLTYREQEYSEIARDFDDDIRAFLIGEMMQKRQNAESN